MSDKINIFWFRRDLRLLDNAALYHSLKNGKTLAIFILDKDILDKLDKDDARVNFIYNTLDSLKKQLKELKSDLVVFHGTVENVWTDILKQYNVNSVYTNHDYEPYARKRDLFVSKILKQHNINFLTAKDQVIFEKNEILTDNNSVYNVFSAFAKKWKNTLNDFYMKSYPTEKYFNNFYKIKHTPLLSLNEYGFQTSSIKLPSPDINLDLIKQYDKNRNYPAINGTTHLGIHLRFGTISIRTLTQIAIKNNETFLNEIIWRDFFMYLLYHYPKLVNKCFREEFESIVWENNKDKFNMWKNGQTGVPIVDAGMRELNSTGFMHNRVRMIVASYLCKNLKVDWKYGERYFAKKLLDFDLSANVGNFQWCAGCGIDASPYFRIFNPYLQAEKFDPNNEYIKKWVPEFDSPDYKEVIDFKKSRDEILEIYKKYIK
jgi:deoxyribodipyrimidine photo-lyase